MRKANLLSSTTSIANFPTEAEFKPSAPPPRAAWPIDEAAYRMGISRVSIYKLAKEGRLNLIKIAGRTLVPDSEIVRLTTPAPSVEAA